MAPLATGCVAPAEEPRQQLPVAAHPPVHALGIGRVGGRVVFEQDEIGGERRAAVNPLEQIVTDERVLGRTLLDALHEGVDVVDALADVDSGAEQILIHLGARVRVDVEADVAREDPREPRLA